MSSKTVCDACDKEVEEDADKTMIFHKGITYDLCSRCGNVVIKTVVSELRKLNKGVDVNNSSVER